MSDPPNTVTEEDRKIISEFTKELSDRFSEKKSRRDLHLAKNNADNSGKKREANVKKNAAFIKKLKVVSENQHTALMKEAAGLDLTRYLAEIVHALTHDCKFKIADMSFVVNFCSHLYLTYDEFPKLLAEAWQKNCLVPVSKAGDTSSVAISSTIVNKLRFDLRLLAELAIIGIWTSEKDGLSLLAGQLRTITSHAEASMFIPVIISFLKHLGPEYAKLIPRRFMVIARNTASVLPECKLIPSQFQEGCSRLLKEFLNTAVKKLNNEQREFHQMESQCLKVVQSRGELPPDERAKWESAKLDLERLKSTVSNLADLVDEDAPILEDLTEKEDGDSLTSRQQKQLETQNLLAAAAAISEGNAEEPPDLFADENETSFYRTFPTLQSSKLPGKDDDDDDGDGEVEISLEVDEESGVSDSGISKDKEDKTKSLPNKEKDIEGTTEQQSKVTEVSTTEEQRLLRRKKLTDLLESLPNCANLELIDNLAQEFATNGFTGRGTSIRLARALLAAPRTRGYILPFYGRLIGTLKPLMPDLPEKVSNALTKELSYHIHKKDQVKIESKLKTVRFIGELVKFGLYGKPEVLRFLSTLTRDFTFHSLEMLSALLEACGRQLVRWPDTQLKMKLIVDAITRKRASQVLDSRYQLLLDNALVGVKKQEESTGVSSFVREIGDPIQLFVINQLARELNRQTANAVMKRLRMLDWDDPAIFDWLPNIIVSVVGTKLPFSRLPLLASIISALGDYGYGVIGIRIVDIILEHLRLSLEHPNISLQQVRLAEARLLGECYNYRLCDSPVILRTLYLLITFGAGLPDIDPPDNLFRIRMACIILDTCGPYFDRGAHKRKLDTYLLYLQLYFWQKKSDPFWESNGLPFPVSVQHQYLDTLDLLRPEAKPYPSLGQVEKAVNEKEQEMSKFVPKPGESSVNLIGTRSGESELEDEEEDDDDKEDGQDVDDEDDDDVGEGHDDSGSESNDEDVEGEQAVEHVDDDAEIHALKGQGPRVIHCPEDDEFLADLEAQLQGAQSSAPPSNALPSTLTDLSSTALQAAKAKAIMQANKIADPESLSESEAPGVVPFVLVARKGTRPHLAPVTVPKSSALVSGYLKHQEQEDAEKAQLKKRILSHQYRQEREDAGMFH